jgi:hypothetical protein
VVRNKTALSLTWLAVALGVLAVPSTASAQPTDLFTCIFLFHESPTCVEIGSSVTVLPQCPGRFFAHFVGYYAWYPLRYVGPIEIEFETGSSVFTQYPLYVQIVPLAGVDPLSEVCGNVPGYVVLTLFPRRSWRPDPCDLWESSGLVDLSALLTLGDRYALRVFAVRHRNGDSPGVDCVRVTAYPEQTGRVATTGWGSVKCLYR